MFVGIQILEFVADGINNVFTGTMFNAFRRRT